MIDFGDDLSKNFGYHRHGWSWVVSRLAEHLHSDTSPIRLLSFVEQSLLFQDSNSSFYDLNQSSKPWVGIFHLPPAVPRIQSRTHQLSRLVSEPRLSNVMRSCIGTISLSSYLQSYIESSIHPQYPAVSILHPAPYEVERFKPDIFTSRLSSTGRVRIVQLGFWLRKHHLIHELDQLIPARLDAFQVGINNFRQYQSLQLDCFLNNAKLSPNVFITNKLSAERYDQLLTESIVLLPLYDTSANNSLIECITRCTPVLVERHPAVEEYLGADYPMYYESIFDLCARLEDPGIKETILSAHQYLMALCETRQLQIDQAVGKFADFFQSVC